MCSQCIPRLRLRLALAVPAAIAAFAPAGAAQGARPDAPPPAPAQGARADARAPAARQQPPAPTPDGTAALKAMQARLPAGFTALAEPPFVVACEGDEKNARRHCEQTVRWAVRLLQQDFFDKPPERVLEIWLFQGDRSYRKYAKELFGDEPSTPFGYYSSAHGALIMNIATGGGTLVHEIVHPFVEANAPGCPAWLNEGLGSLFEQSRERNGHIEGAVNWRLDGLQQAIRDKRTIPIDKLVATTSAQFYGDESGVHYAMARYLMLWLQEHGALRAFWRDWLATRKDDASGLRALQKALGAADVAAFQKDWERWALALKRE
jgi:hypothetical protein